jgi:gluconolactonase
MKSSSPVFDTSTLEVVCHGLGYSQGPIAMPDGTLLLVDIKNECLTRIRPDGSQELVVKVPGGPNGAAVGPDGKIYMCNNGGFEWKEMLLFNGQVISVGEYQSPDYQGGSLVSG